MSKRKMAKKNLQRAKSILRSGDNRDPLLEAEDIFSGDSKFSTFSKLAILCGEFEFSGRDMLRSILKSC